MLPTATDWDLRKELAVIVTSGWAIQNQRQHEDDVRRLLELAPPRSRARFPRRAHDMLIAIDTSLQDAARDKEEQEPFLTEDQALGLRILLGTHQNYRTVTAQVRRDNAAEYLGEARRGGRIVTGATLYKRRQDELLQLVVDCLRRSYTAEPGGPMLHFETEMVSAMLHFDEHKRVAWTFFHYIRRARHDGQRRMYVRAELPKGATGATVTSYTGIQFVHVRVYTHGHLSIAFEAPSAVGIGQRQSFGFRLDFVYPEPVIVPTEGHLMHWEHTDFYQLNLHVRFEEHTPSECWYFANTMIDYPLPAEPGKGLVKWKGGSAHRRTSGTWARMAHGIAWRW